MQCNVASCICICFSKCIVVVIVCRIGSGSGSYSCPSIYLSVCRSVWLSVCLSVSLSLCLCVCLSRCLSLCLSVSVSVCLCACLSLCLSVSVFVSVSVCLCLSVRLFVHPSVCPSVCLCVSLQATNLFCLTSSIFDLGNIKNAAIPRDFLNFRSWQQQKRSHSARLPSNIESWVQSWRPRPNAFCDFATKKTCQVIRSAAPVTQNHLSKPEDLMLQNATPLRISAPWPPNISDEYVSCIVPATWISSFQIHVPRLPSF